VDGVVGGGVEWMVCHRLVTESVQWKIEIRYRRFYCLIKWFRYNSRRSYLIKFSGIIPNPNYLIKFSGIIPNPNYLIKAIRRGVENKKYTTWYTHSQIS
jgi:hypothetical protein